MQEQAARPVLDLALHRLVNQLPLVVRLHRLVVEERRLPLASLQAVVLDNSNLDLVSNRVARLHSGEEDSGSNRVGSDNNQEGE